MRSTPPVVASKRSRDSQNKLTGSLNGVKFSARLQTSTEKSPTATITDAPKILTADVRAYLDNEAQEKSESDTSDLDNSEDDFSRQFE